jgi:hypothetical protein
MAVTQTEQIAELIQESTALNQTFHEKEEIIDEKIVFAETKVDSKIIELEDWKKTAIKDEMNRTVYVDGVNGNDDTAQEGDVSKPYKTIDKAYYDNRQFAGKFSMKIKAIPDYTYVYKLNMYSYGGNVFRLETWDYDGTNRAKIQPIADMIRVNDQDQIIMKRFEIWESGHMSINHIEIVIPDKTVFTYDSWYYGGTPFLINGGGSLFLFDVVVDILAQRNDLILVTGNYGTPSIHIHGSNINMGDRYLIYNKYDAPCILDVLFSDLWAINLDVQYVKNIVRDVDSGNPINLISNLNFSL